MFLCLFVNFCEFGVLSYQFYWFQSTSSSIRGVLRSFSTGLIQTMIGHVMLNNSRTCMVDKLVKIKSTLALVYNQIFRPSPGTAGRRWISCARHSSEGLPLHSQNLLPRISNQYWKPSKISCSKNIFWPERPRQGNIGWWPNIMDACLNMPWAQLNFFSYFYLLCDFFLFHQIKLSLIPNSYNWDVETRNIQEQVEKKIPEEL